MKTTNIILTIFLVVLVFYLLSVLSSILIPLVLAFLVASMFQPLIQLLQKMKVPKWLTLPAVAVVTLIILFVLVSITAETATEISEQQVYLLDRLTLKLNLVLDWFASVTGNDTPFDVKTLIGLLDKEFISSSLGNAATAVSTFTASSIMFVLYYVVLLASMPKYKSFILYVGGRDAGKKLLKSYESVQKSIYSYIIVKTFISIGTGLLAAIICLLFGIKFAFFWGFVTFLLNFIPNIGSIASTIFPTMMGIIQFDSLQAVLFLLICLMSVQLIMGNFVEPVIMGSQLRLNTLTVIFGLVFWGWLWGIIGMILSVPLMVIFKLVLEQFPDFAVIGRLMGSPEAETAPVKTTK